MDPKTAEENFQTAQDEKVYCTELVVGETRVRAITLNEDGTDDDSMQEVIRHARNTMTYATNSATITVVNAFGELEFIPGYAINRFVITETTKQELDAFRNNPRVREAYAALDAVIAQDRAEAEARSRAKSTALVPEGDIEFREA